MTAANLKPWPEQGDNTKIFYDLGWKSIIKFLSGVTV